MKLVRDEKTGEWPEHKKYFQCTLNGTHIEHICCGADEENGWADVLIYGNDFKLVTEVGTKKPMIVRIYGNVKLIDTRKGEN
jgi:hypothetical protein